LGAPATVANIPIVPDVVFPSDEQTGFYRRLCGVAVVPAPFFITAKVGAESERASRPGGDRPPGRAVKLLRLDFA